MPKPVQIGDEIIVKGKIKDDAKVFSVNFVPEYPMNIIYHFKTNFVANNVVQNYKTAGKWNDELTEENTWIVGPGEEFVLTFFFDDNKILVTFIPSNYGAILIL